MNAVSPSRPAGNGQDSLRQQVARLPRGDERALADLIHDDGIARVRNGQPVTLDRYIAAVPDLPQRADPLDAALSVVLQSAVSRGLNQRDAVAALVGKFPSLEKAVRDAAALNGAMLSTSGLERRLADPLARELPAAVGPALHDGRRRYELRDRLGFGSFGQVYLAKDHLLSEEDHEALVAIKFIPAGQAPGSVQEATRTRRIDHPGIVRALDSGRADGEDYIVYEFIDGGSLAERLQKHPPPMEHKAAARLVATVARAVQAAHSAGLIHCDLKPSNILLTKSNDPKVTDFGIAVRAAEGLAAERSGPRPLGNLAFISPEQYRSEPGGRSASSDIYALGGILYLLVTGALPNGATPDEVERTHRGPDSRNHAPAIPASARVDRDLAAICRRALAPRPGDRYAAAGQLADDLEAWLKHYALAWNPPGAWRSIRMLARRQPVAVAIAAAWSITLVAATVAIVYLVSEVSREKRQLAESTEAAMSVHRELPRVVTLEVEAVQPFLGSDAVANAFRTNRIEALEQTISISRSGGRERLMLWTVQQAKLLIWLLSDGKWERALTVVGEAREKWKGFLEPGDVWLRALDVIEDHARVDRLIDLVAKDQAPANWREEARALRSRLEAAESVLIRTAPGSGTHSVALCGLRAVSGPRLLNDPEALAEWNRRAAESGAKRVNAGG